MTKKKVQIQNEIRFRAYTIIESAVEQGVMAGYRRAHKHSDNPGEEFITEQVILYVMNELSDVIDWELGEE